MGRQLPVVMTFNDEQLFLSQLKNIGDFVLIESFADTRDELFPNNFNEHLENHFVYYLWNKKLAWEPKFKYTETGNKKIYIENKINAPYIQFSRQHSFSVPNEKSYGRIYINMFSEENLSYDKNEFIKTYNEIIQIIKKTSPGKIKDNNWVTYFYPESWENFQKKKKDE